PNCPEPSDKTSRPTRRGPHIQYDIRNYFVRDQDERSRHVFRLGAALLAWLGKKPQTRQRIRVMAGRLRPLVSVGAAARRIWPPSNAPRTLFERLFVVLPRLRKSAESIGIPLAG